MPEGSEPCEVVPEGGPGCSGAQLQAERAARVRDYHQRDIYIFIVLIQKRGIGEEEEPAKLRLSGVPSPAQTSPTTSGDWVIPSGQINLPPAAAITTQAIGSIFCPAAWIPAPRRRGRHLAAPAAARAPASQSPVQKHSIRVAWLALLGGRPVDQHRVLLEGTRPSQRNHHRSLQGRCVWFGASH